jgi:hypothetical protein
MEDATSTSVPDAAEVLADPHKLRGWHADDCLVLRIRDAEVLAVDVHQLHLEISNLILFYSLTQKSPRSQSRTNRQQR